MRRTFDTLAELSHAIEQGGIRAGDELVITNHLFEDLTPAFFADLTGWLDYVGLGWRVRLEPGLTVFTILPEPSRTD
jgi:hypothetical protein